MNKGAHLGGAGDAYAPPLFLPRPALEVKSAPKVSLQSKLTPEIRGFLSARPGNQVQSICIQVDFLG